MIASLAACHFAPWPPSRSPAWPAHPSWLAGFLTLLGTAIAYWLYVVKEGAAKEMADRKGPLWTFLYNKWFFDELYDATFVRAARMQ